MREIPGSSGLDLGQRARGGFHSDNRTVGVAACFLPSFENEAQPMIVLPHVVAEEEMPRTLNRGQEDIFVAIVIEVGEDSSAPVGDGINPGYAGDVHELSTFAIEEESVAFVATERESLLEDQPVLIVAQRAAFLLGVILRHDLTPELTSSVLHGLSGDETVGSIEIAPAVIVEVDEAAAPGPSGRQAADIGGHVLVLAIA